MAPATLEEMVEAVAPSGGEGEADAHSDSQTAFILESTPILFTSQV